MPVKLVVQRFNEGECSVAGLPEIEAFDAENPNRVRRIKILAYDGGMLNLPNYDYPLVIDNQGWELRDQIRPILIDHKKDADHILGQTDRITVSATEMMAEGELMGAGPIAKQVIEANDRGFRFEASVGAKPTIKPQFIPAGKTVAVNGRQFTGPLYVSRKTRLGEISFVIIGAAQKSAASIAASAAGGLEMPTFEQFVSEMGFDPATLSEQQRASLQALYDSAEPAADPANASGGPNNPPPAPVPAPTPAQAPANASGTMDINASDLAEIQRGAAIHAICNGTRGNFPQIEAQAIEGNWDVRRTSLEVIRQSRPRAPGVVVRNNTRDQNVIEASLVFAAGINPNVALERGWFDERTIEAAESSQWSGMSLCRAGHEIVAAAGGHLRPGRLDTEGVRHIFECERRLLSNPSGWSIEASGSGTAFSTLSLSGALGGMLRKLLLNSFLEVESVIPQISVKQSPTDYKSFNAYQITMDGELEEIGSNGQLPDVSLSEEEFSNQVKLRGAYLSVSEVTFVNDDLGIFAQVPKMFGRNAAIGREKVGLTTFLAGQGTFYSTANGNYMQGSDTALSIAALTAASKLADEQTDSNGDPIMLPMTRIFVPPALKVEAGSLYTEKNIVISGSASTTKTANNPHVGSFQPLVSPFLGTKFGLTGSSETAFYLLPTPGDIAPLQAAYLNGQEQPTVEKGDVDFRQLGMAWRVTYRFGFAKGNKRAVVKSNGASE